ncbi:uncharacterized protein [Ptychodera flava]|uniref:uncharacterized protein n=1 Tax=Ptychodera flava TaxID=63121 RepID=UPI003969C9F8
MDEPGIPSVERFKMKLRYRESLLSMVDMYSFPPPRMYVKGYPKALWESTISSIDADLILCGLVKRRTYNQRAISSQMCESLFGSLSSLSSSRNGVPNCVDLETNFAKICGEMVVRYDPNRGFPVRLSSATVYPQQQLEVDSGPLPQPMPLRLSFQR